MINFTENDVHLKRVSESISKRQKVEQIALTTRIEVLLFLVSIAEALSGQMSSSLYGDSYPGWSLVHQKPPSHTHILGVVSSSALPTCLIIRLVSRSWPFTSAYLSSSLAHCSQLGRLLGQVNVLQTWHVTHPQPIFYSRPRKFLWLWEKIDSTIPKDAIPIILVKLNINISLVNDP